MKKRWYYLFAPVATAALVLQIYYNYHLFPFSNQTLAWCDMKQQVIPILLDFKNVLSGQSNMFLNLSNAGGMSFWGVFLFFISSPFSFLVAFIDKSAIYVFVNILVLLKMSFCAYMASLFFGRQFKNLNAMQNVSLSVMYAFCGYTMMYFQNIVWLDMMCIFPILLIGLDMLIEQQKIWLFVLAFSITITINFYLSYMIVAFLILILGIYILFFFDSEKRKKSILLLCLSVMLVALITAVIWLPSLMQYLNSARTVGLIESISSGKFFTDIYTSLPILLCSSAVIAAIFMLPMIFDCKNKKAVAVLLVFILMFIPLFVDPINKMWHTGSYQAFPARFGYIFIFLGLILLAEQISQLNLAHTSIQRNSNLLTTIGLTIAFAGTVMLAKILIVGNYNALTVYTRTLWENKDSIMLSGTFVLASVLTYLLMMLAYKYKHINMRIFSILLCLMVVCQSLFSGNIFLGSAANSSGPYQYVLDLGGQIKDSSLYRVKNNKKYFDVNLVGGLGYNTLNHYTSLTGKDYMYAMKKLGYSSYWMEVNSCGGTEFSDAVLANKYSIVYTGDLDKSSNTVYSNKCFSIINNPLSLAFGTIMNTNNIDQYRYLPETSRMDIQQSMFEAICGSSKQLVTHYNFIDSDNLNFDDNGDATILMKPDFEKVGMLSYSIDVKGTQTLYFDCFDKLSNHLSEPINKGFNVFVNGKSIETSYPKENNNGLLNLGTFTDENVVVKIDVLKDICAKSFGVTGLHTDTLSTAMKQVKTANLKQEGNTIIGTASANGINQYLFLPLPYDDGYSIYVNNQKVQIHQVFDTFMAVKLNNGSNAIKITYVPQGFIIGCILSICGIALFVVLLWLLKRGFYKKLKFLEWPASLIFVLLFVVVFIGIYIFPIIAYLKLC